MAAKFSPLLRIVCKSHVLQTVSSTAKRYSQTTIPVTGVTEQDKRLDPTFDSLLESSRFLAHCGETPVGQKVVANIIAERDKDIYVDFGGKFYAVVARPANNGHLYTKGKWVDVILEDIEVTEHFLGDSKDTSLLEAQVKLIGLSTFIPQ